MCIPIIPPDEVGGKPPNEDRADRKIEGWAPYGAKQDAYGGRHTAPSPLQDYLRKEAFEGLFPSSLACSLGQGAALIPLVERRRANRLLLIGAGQSAIILRPYERQVARSQLIQAERCGQGFATFRGYEARDGGDRELRICVQKKCGTRRCDSCDEEIRRHQMHRSEGKWTLFFTLTLPRNGSAAGAWRIIHKLVRCWHRELRRELEISRRPWVEKGKRRSDQRNARIRRAKENIRATGSFEYAWVLESHEDAWPHVHECVSLAWLRYGFARHVWSRIVRDRSARIDGQKVWDVKGVCRYLSMYVSKARLAPEILAILRGRRVWASTTRAGKRPEARWVEEKGTSSDQARDEIEHAETWGEREGWVLEASKPNAYARWWRVARFEHVVREVSGSDALRLDVAYLGGLRLARVGFDLEYLDAATERIESDLG